MRRIQGNGAILIVEDDQAINALIKEALEEDGFTTFSAHNAAQAEVLGEEKNIKLVLLDLLLPDTDGLVLCSSIKTRFNVPVIIVSGTSETRDRVLAFKLGADDFITKPFDLEELVARVEAVLRGYAPKHPNRLMHRTGI